MGAIININKEQQVEAVVLNTAGYFSIDWGCWQGCDSDLQLLVFPSEFHWCYYYRAIFYTQYVTA